MRNKQVLPAKLVKELDSLRGEFSSVAESRKGEILRILASTQIRSTALLKTLHHILCFYSAFPGTEETLELSRKELTRFESRVLSLPEKLRWQLDDSGIAGSELLYDFSYDLARYLAQRFPKQADIYWDRFAHTEKLKDLLSYLVPKFEEELIKDPKLSLESWFQGLPRSRTKAARGAGLRFIISQLRAASPKEKINSYLYNALHLPIAWRFGKDSGITNARLTPPFAARRTGWRRVEPRTIRDIRRRLHSFRRVSPEEGRRIIDSTLTALMVRRREVYSMIHANPNEVYIADIGLGGSVAVMGVFPEDRLPIEGSYGYMIYSNGMPVGYGGISPVFFQGNTGVNIFNEYRGSESAYLFVQTLRFFRTLFGCESFVVNPYQFGKDNKEGLTSSAFWFYYKLGFVPERTEVARTAATEWTRLKKSSTPTGARVMNKLLSCNLILSLTPTAKSRYIPEEWMESIPWAGVEELIDMLPASHSESLKCAGNKLANQLGGNRSSWSVEERREFDEAAPLILRLPKLARYSQARKQKLLQTLRLKGGKLERDFLLALQKDQALFREFKKFCRSRAKKLRD